MNNTSRSFSIFFLTSTLKTLTISSSINSPEYWALLSLILLHTCFPGRSYFLTPDQYSPKYLRRTHRSLGFSLSAILSSLEACPENSCLNWKSSLLSFVLISYFHCPRLICSFSNLLNRTFNSCNITLSYL